MATQSKAFNTMVKKKMKTKKKDLMPVGSKPTGADAIGMPVKKKEMGYAS